MPNKIFTDYLNSFMLSRLGMIISQRLIFFGIVLIVLVALIQFFHFFHHYLFIFIVLVFFAIIGIGFLFALTIGVLQFKFFYPPHPLFKLFLDSMHQGLIVTDQKGHIVYVNRAYTKMVGAKSLSDVRTMEDQFSSIPEASSVFLKMRKSLKDEGKAEGEFNFPSAFLENSLDSSYRVYAQELQIFEQKEFFYAWQLYDISQERYEQNRLFLNLKKTCKDLDQLAVGFFSMHKNGQISYCNQILAHWLGFDSNQHQNALFLSDILTKDGMALIQAMKPKENGSLEKIIDLDLLTIAGKIMPVRFFYRVSHTMEEENSENFACALVLNQSFEDDLTTQLRLAEIRFARFFHSVPMALLSLNAEGKIVSTNAAFLSLFSSSPDCHFMEEKSDFETFIHESNKEEFKKAFLKACQGESSIAPIDTVFPGNQERHIRYYLNPLIDPIYKDFMEESVIVYATDITEQKVIETQMVQTQKMQAIGQLAGGIAHDFNNVLTAIIMSSDLLLANHRLSDPFFSDIMNIKQNANRAASLVRQLLAFSRKQTLRTEIFNLIDVLADLRLLLIRLIEPEIKLLIDHGADLWPLKTDIGQFEQVIVNLIVNARDAMPDGGEIIIRTRNVTREETRIFGYQELFPADYVLIEIEDHGTGIPDYLKEKIFEPFFTTKEVGKGTGLGLSMVYGIIKQTGGLIFCSSKLGKGTIFRIFLPPYVLSEEELLKPPMPDGSDLDSKETIASDLSGSATILLVEDEDSVRMGSVRALESRGYKVYEASSGVEALEIFKTCHEQVDLIVSDVVMPEMDGPTFLGEVRKINPHIKFIFVSGYAEDAFSRNLPPEEDFVFIAKPFSLKQLAVVVKKTLEQKIIV